ncbi:hypothetical protein [Actinomadura sp. RB99]|uniref:hypothetical protein n=1 Tax=Actinomadura sp. RB99 TaxID=2691577 RepID=UPI0016831E0D|nr:hypothetical protein [Actinomadura sp. RB99]
MTRHSGCGIAKSTGYGLNTGYGLSTDAVGAADRSAVPAIRRPRAGVNSAPVWRYARDMGMKVYFQTDMPALSAPLKRYLGDIDTSSPWLWSVTPAGTTAPRSR